jgi:hypothetical protein
MQQGNDARAKKISGFADRSGKAAQTRIQVSTMNIAKGCLPT